MEAAPAAVIVLAAGAGTRMVSETPKVLHRIGGRSLLSHAIHAAQGTAPARISVVVRHEREAVAAHALEFDPSVLIADQDDIPGTGRAAQCALSALDAAAHAQRVVEAGVPLGDEGRVLGDGIEGPVLVIAGDVPLLDAESLRGLLQAHVAGGHAVTLLTTTVSDPTGYGRILRDGATDAVVGIVEERDATDEQRSIAEINSSVYVFDAATLRAGLSSVDRNNAQGEIYLTDVLAYAHRCGQIVRGVHLNDPILLEGVNDRVQLSALGTELNRRTLLKWMRAGVTVVDPNSTWVDVDVDLAADVTLLPGVQLHGATSIARGATIGPDTTLTDVEVGEGATVIRTHGSLAVIGKDALVGPFAYLRPGTDLGERGKIGTFVEVKNGRIGAGSKVPHLSYVGDATIGEGANIGAGTIFVNYDGVRKHHTTVGDQARTGSNNIFIAPVNIGDGAYTGGGSVIRFDVPAGALAVSAGTQRIIPGWVERRRPGTPPAEAAAAARGEQPTSELGVQAREEKARAETTAIPQFPLDTPAYGYRVPDLDRPVSSERPQLSTNDEGNAHS